jgi:prepilin-type N-terminal cleavage/methylation domain-containing protein
MHRRLSKDNAILILLMNEIRNTKCELRVTGHERRGFTLAELVVAIGIMAIVVFIAGTVFKTSIASYRVASAQAEIMQKFRAITDQLNNDFRGLRKDAPMFIWFQVDPCDVNNRLDRIMFFADGDFQSTQTYDTDTNAASPYFGYIVPQRSGSPVVSNLARILYGQAKSIDPRDNISKFPYNLRTADRILSKRQHLYIADQDYWQFPDHNFSGFLVVDPCFNDRFEHDTNSLSQWQAAANDAAKNPTNVNNIITGCFDGNYPLINLANANTLHLLLTENVGSFAVQWSYYYVDTSVPPNQYVYWWPSIDPDGNGNFDDSDFGKAYMNLDAFGFYFNTASASVPYWFQYSGAQGFYYPNPLNPLDKPVYPRALKFTFTLYDSRGVFKDGQTFTHIVYIGD